MTASRLCHDARRRRCRLLAALIASATLGTASSVRAEPAVARRAEPRPAAMVDPAVVPAGGLRCRECGTAACPLHRSHLPACRDGLCAPHCPVRPGQYGYYRTQWRRWPDPGVTQASAEEAAEPAPPPKSLVPSADEESPGQPAAGPAAQDAADDDPARPADAAGDGRGDDDRPADPIPENPAGRTDRDDPAAADPDGRVPPVPPGDEPVRPRSGGAADRPEGAAVRPDEAYPTVEVGAMRYPAPVGRSLAAGAVPWRLEPAARQRPADSARGL